MTTKREERIAQYARIEEVINDNKMLRGCNSAVHLITDGTYKDWEGRARESYIVCLECDLSGNLHAEELFDLLEKLKKHKIYLTFWVNTHHQELIFLTKEHWKEIEHELNRVSGPMI